MIIKLNTENSILKINNKAVVDYSFIAPSPTPTPTPTPTNSATPTLTPTSSVTPTPTLTPTVTPTSSVTPTPTLTPTVTSTNSATPTLTPTSSVTPTSTLTPTITPTNSATPTSTPIPEFYFANFEDASKTSYSSANIMINGIEWNLDQALIGSTSGDIKNDSKSVRLRNNGSMTMNFDLSTGIDKVSFFYSRSNFTGDRTGIDPSFVVEYSTDSGTSWSQTGDTTNLENINNLTYFTTTINIISNIRIRIRQTAGDEGQRWNIDDLIITTVNTFIPSPTPTSSITPTITPTITASVTPTLTSFYDPSPTPTQSITPTPTPIVDYIADFEDASKTSYTSGNIMINNIEWNLNEALIGTLAADWKIGSKSLRLRGFVASEATMLSDKLGGAGIFSFQYRRYGTDTQVEWRIQSSIDSGISWNNVGSPFTAPSDDIVQTFSEIINTNNPIRFRIIYNNGGNSTTNRRLNIDNITITTTNNLTPSATPTNSVTPSVSPTNSVGVTPTVTSTPLAFIPAGANSANFGNCAPWNGSSGNVTTVGSNGGASAYGTYDQSGNASEWNEAVIGSSRGRRGGNWNISAFNLSSSDRNSLAPSNEFGTTGFRLSSSLNPLNLSYFVNVGDSGNSNDSTGYGGVSYSYAIGQYPVTNCEYIEFLNAVAATDTYNLYNTFMGSDVRGGITRSGSSGSYTYSVKTNMGNKPVVYVAWFDCARYCNWLHNGKPSGNQDNSTTEDGAYTLNGTTSGVSITRNVNASYYIPSENEWYKAAYYKGGGTNAGYWTYATQSNTAPNCVTADENGNGPVASNYSCS